MRIKMSASSMKNFSKCPKYYFWAKVEGIETREKSDALKLGKYVDDIVGNGKSEVEESDEQSVWLAKGRSIIRAMESLGISKIFDKYEKQKPIEFEIENNGTIVDITGFMDFAANDHIGELKVSVKPESYLNKWFIGEQVGTYLMSMIEYNSVIMYVVQVPELKYNESKETAGDYEARCYEDIMRRPGYYFHGLNKEKDSFGVKFMRQEFDLIHLAQKYIWLAKQIVDCHENKFWPDRRSECFNPFKCDYLEACSIGVSMDRYKKREDR